jgi:hypothetical protein
MTKRKKSAAWSTMRFLPSFMSSWIMAPDIYKGQLCYSVSRQFFQGHFLSILGTKGMCLPHKIIHQESQLAFSIFCSQSNNSSVVLAHSVNSTNTALSKFYVRTFGRMHNYSPIHSQCSFPVPQTLAHHLLPSCPFLLLEFSVGSQATSSNLQCLQFFFFFNFVPPTPHILWLIR